MSNFFQYITVDNLVNNLTPKWGVEPFGGIQLKKDLVKPVFTPFDGHEYSPIDMNTLEDADDLYRSLLKPDIINKSTPIDAALPENIIMTTSSGKKVVQVPPRINAGHARAKAISRQFYDIKQRANKMGWEMPHLDLQTVSRYYTEGPSFKRTPRLGIVSSDLSPERFAYATAQNSVMQEHPYLHNTLTPSARVLHKNLAWMVPGAIFGRQFLADKTDTLADNVVYNAISKYGPEAYLAAGAASMIDPIRAISRTHELIPNSKPYLGGLRQNAWMQVAKLGLGYGALSGLRMLSNRYKNSDSNIEKKSSPNWLTRFKNSFIDNTWDLAPVILPYGLLLGGLGYMAYNAPSPEKMPPDRLSASLAYKQQEQKVPMYLSDIDTLVRNNKIKKGLPIDPFSS